MGRFPWPLLGWLTHIVIDIPTHEKNFYPKMEILSWTDKDWENINEDEFRKIFKGSAVKRTKHVGLLRNIKENK